MTAIKTDSQKIGDAIQEVADQPVNLEAVTEDLKTLIQDPEIIEKARKRLTTLVADLSEQISKNLTAMFEVAEIVELLPPLIGDIKHVSCSYGLLSLTIPYDREAIKKNTERMTEAGFSIGYEYLDETHYEPYIRFTHPDYIVERTEEDRRQYSFDVSLKYSFSYDEATCVRSKIGEETIKRDLFEITCRDGESEETFVQSEETVVESDN